MNMVTNQLLMLGEEEQAAVLLMQLSLMDFDVEDDQNMELKRHTHDRSSDLQPIRHLRNGLRRAPAVGFEDSVEEGVEKEWRWWWW